MVSPPRVGRAHGRRARMETAYACAQRAYTPRTRTRKSCFRAQDKGLRRARSNGPTGGAGRRLRRRPSGGTGAARFVRAAQREGSHALRARAATPAEERCGRGVRTSRGGALRAGCSMGCGPARRLRLRTCQGPRAPPVRALPRTSTQCRTPPLLVRVLDGLLGVLPRLAVVLDGLRRVACRG